MKKTVRKAAVRTSVRAIEESRPDYATAMTVHAVYRKGRFEPQEPVAALSENQAVELVVRTGAPTQPVSFPDDLTQRATRIVQRAKLRAAEQASQLMAAEAQAAYDKAAAALRRELRRK